MTIAKDSCPSCGDYMWVGAEIINGEKMRFNVCPWCWYDERKQSKNMQDVGGESRGGHNSKVE